MNQRNDNSSATGLIIGVIVVVLLGIAAYAFLAGDDPLADTIVEDETLLPNVNDDGVTIDGTDDPTEDENATGEQNLIIIEDNLIDGNIDAVVGTVFASETAVVTETVSDQLFRISSADQKGGEGVLMYLEQPADVQISAGDAITVSGTFVANLEGMTLSEEESSAVAAEQALLLASDVEVQN